MFRDVVGLGESRLFKELEGALIILYLRRKTTVMVFKMLGIERAWTMHNGEAKPRQLFVTQSRVLAGKVEEYFLKVLDSFSIASLTPREIAKRAKEKQSRNEDGVLVDLDDDTRWRNDLPERFSQLDDRHFPLFITFDKVGSRVFLDRVDIYQLDESSSASYWKLTCPIRA